MANRITEQPINSPKKFLKFIAYLQVIGIILVVIGHSGHEYPDGHNGTSTLFYQLLYSFRMPLFMFVSGFLMVYTTKITDTSTQIERKPLAYIGEKTKRLLLPFCFLTAITFLPRVMMSSIADDYVSLSLHSFIFAFLDKQYMPIPYFWFIQASFILLCINYCVLYSTRKARISAHIITTSLLGLFILFYLSDIPTTRIFSLNEVKRLGLFFIMGCSYCVFAKLIDNIIPWQRWWLFALCLTAWGCSFFAFQNTPWILLCSILGIMMCISLAKIIEARNWHFLDHLQGANYMIFLLSWYCNVACQQVLSHFISLPWYIYSILSFVSGIYVPYLVYKYLENHQNSKSIRILTILLGQSFHKKS